MTINSERNGLIGIAADWSSRRKRPPTLRLICELFSLTEDEAAIAAGLAEIYREWRTA